MTKKQKEAKVQKLPDGIKVVGIFKMKDKDKRDIISFPVDSAVEGIIIQKVKGESNRIIVAVKMYDWAVKKEKEAQKVIDKETKEKTKNETIKS